MGKENDNTIYYNIRILLIELERKKNGKNWRRDNESVGNRDGYIVRTHCSWLRIVAPVFESAPKGYTVAGQR